MKEIIKTTISYLNEFGVDANTTATIFITILVFILGYAVSGFFENLKESRKKYNYRKSMLLLITDLKKQCGRQFVVINSSLKDCSLILGTDINVKYIKLSTLDYLNSIDLNTFLENFDSPFFSNKRSKAVSKLLETIALIKTENETIYSNQKEYFEVYQKHEANYQKHIRSLTQLIENLAMQYSGKVIYKKDGAELLQGYFDVLNHWKRNGAKTAMYFTHKEIILQIMALNKKYQNFPLIFETGPFALECNLAFLNIEKVEQLMKDNFRDFARSHRRAEKILGVTIKYLK